MGVSDWNAAASNVAGDIRQNRYPFQRGLVCIPCPEEGMVVAWMLGNDGYALKAEVKRELTIIRQRLTGSEVQELGFGLSNDGHSWALALKADNRRYQTAIGKALHLQLLKIHLNDTILRAAWEATFESRSSRAGWNIERREKVG